MPSVEERLAYLEGRVGDQTDAIVNIRTDIRGLRGEMSGLRGEMSGLRGEMSGLRGEMNGGFAAMRTEMDARFAGVDAKVTWVIGIQVGMLLMIAGAALGFFFK
jgi:carbon monoxide dehydrogenase subunit G